MKLLYLLCVAVYLASVMGMPSKVSLTPLSSEEDYGSVRGSGTLQNLASLHDRYPIYVLGPYRSDDRQRPNLNTLRAYINNINADSLMLRKFLLSKLVAQCANQNKSLTQNQLCNHIFDSDNNNIYFTVSPELQLTNESSKIKKNFDEIDKTSASFSTLNQLI
ncbi:orcokinin isoform 1-T1 [Cochliomyia hominivorax]